MASTARGGVTLVLFDHSALASRASRWPGVESIKLPHCIEAESQYTKQQHLAQWVQAVLVVQPVTGGAALRRLQQADLVVVMQRRWMSLATWLTV